MKMIMMVASALVTVASFAQSPGVKVAPGADAPPIPKRGVRVQVVAPRAPIEETCKDSGQCIDLQFTSAIMLPGCKAMFQMVTPEGVTLQFFADTSVPYGPLNFYSEGRNTPFREIPSGTFMLVGDWGMLVEVQDLNRPTVGYMTLLKIARYQGNLAPTGSIVPTPNGLTTEYVARYTTGNALLRYLRDLTTLNLRYREIQGDFLNAASMEEFLFGLTREFSPRDVTVARPGICVPGPAPVRPVPLDELERGVQQPAIIPVPNGAQPRFN